MIRTMPLRSSGSRLCAGPGTAGKGPLLEHFRVKFTFLQRHAQRDIKHILLVHAPDLQTQRPITIFHGSPPGPGATLGHTSTLKLGVIAVTGLVVFGHHRPTGQGIYSKTRPPIPAADTLAPIAHGAIHPRRAYIDTLGCSDKLATEKGRPMKIIDPYRNLRDPATIYKVHKKQDNLSPVRFSHINAIVSTTVRACPT